MAIKVIINEPSIGLTDQTDRIWYHPQGQGVGSNSFTLIQQQRGTGTLVFRVFAGDTYQPTEGCPIYIHEISPAADTIMYAGKILTSALSWIGGAGDRAYTLTCVSLESCFDDILVTRSYPAMTGGALFTLLFADWGSGIPVTIGDVDLTLGGVLPAQPFRNQKLSDILFTAIPGLMGTTVIAGVQMSDSTLYLHAQSTVPAPFVLESYLWETGSLTKDLSNYRNRQLIQLAFTAFSTSNKMFDGDGFTQEVFLPVPVDRVTSASLTTRTQATAVGVFGTLSPTTSVQPLPGDSFTIATPGVVEDPYTFVTVLDNTLRNQILIGATIAETAQNTVDAINAKPSQAGITYSLPTWENDSCNADAYFTGPPITFVLRVRNPGSGGNGVVLTSTPAAISPFLTPAFFWEGMDPSVPFSTAVTAGGTDGPMNALSVGVLAAGTLSNDVNYTPGSNAVQLKAAIPAGASLSVAYYRFGGDTIAVEDSAEVAARAAVEHGSGRYQQIITDTQNADARSGYVKALTALRTYQAIPSTFQFATYIGYPSPINTGQLLTITLLSPTGSPVLLDGVWLVNEVQATLVPGVETLPEPFGHFEYQISVINVNTIPNFVQWWQNLAIVSPAGSQTVNNSSIQSATATLAPTPPADTTPPTTPTQGTPSGTAAGNQWVQEALGRYAIVKATDLVVDAVDDTIVTSASKIFIPADVGISVIVISGTGWTPGEYVIASIVGTGAKLASSPAAAGTTDGIWALVSNQLYCTTWNIAPSYTNNPVAIVSLNGVALNPFPAGYVGYVPGAGDYQITKGNQIFLSGPISPGTDRLMATYFPAGITQAPVGPQTAKIAVNLDLQATDVPFPYTPHIPPGGDRHFWDLEVGGFSQDAKATLTEVGTTDAGIIWSLISSDGNTNPSIIGALSPSAQGDIYRTYTSPLTLPSLRVPPLSDVIILGVQSHADSTVKAFNTITLTGSTPPPTGNYVAVGEFNTGGVQIMTSPDAVTWTVRASGIDSDGGKCIAAVSGTICALGVDHSTGTSNNAVVSTDHGATWATNALPSLTTGETFLDLIVVGSLFVAVSGAFSGAAGQTATSPDGATWTLKSTLTLAGFPDIDALTAIAFGAGLYVAVGNAVGNVNVSSPDLVTWTEQTAPTPGSGSGLWTDVIFAGGQFVAVGGCSTFAQVAPIVQTSPDGITWTGQTSAVPTGGNSFAGIAFGAGVYVAVATDGLVITSSDGITWSSATVTDLTDCQRVRFLNGQFVAAIRIPNVPSQTIVTSPDGITWTVQNTVLDTIVNDVTFG